VATGVLRYDADDVLARVAPLRQQTRQRLQIGNRMQTHRRLLGAEAAV
jgi:hypothetical protein